MTTLKIHISLFLIWVAKYRTIQFNVSSCEHANFISMNGKMKSALREEGSHFLIYLNICIHINIYIYIHMFKYIKKENIITLLLKND